MIECTFVNNTSESVDNLIEIAKPLVDKTYKFLKLEKEYEVSYIFVNNEEIHALNKNYRNKDYPTDVLTFPGEDNYLGDIFISLDQVKIQAPDFNNSFEEEMCFMFVHGLLHSLGYDHELGYDEEQEMFKIQNSILGLQKE